MLQIHLPSVGQPKKNGANQLFFATISSANKNDVISYEIGGVERTQNFKDLSPNGVVVFIDGSFGLPDDSTNKPHYKALCHYNILGNIPVLFIRFSYYL